MIRITDMTTGEVFETGLKRSDRKDMYECLQQIVAEMRPVLPHTTHSILLDKILVQDVKPIYTTPAGDHRQFLTLEIDHYGTAEDVLFKGQYTAKRTTWHGHHAKRKENPPEANLGNSQTGKVSET